MTAKNRASACRLVSMHACAREKRGAVVRKPLYPYVAHHDGKFWNIYGSACGVIILIVVSHFNSLHLWLLLFFKYINSSSRQKG